MVIPIYSSHIDHRQDNETQVRHSRQIYKNDSDSNVRGQPDPRGNPRDLNFQGLHLTFCQMLRPEC